MLQDFIGQCGIHCRLLVHWGGGWGGLGARKSEYNMEGTE